MRPSRVLLVLLLAACATLNGPELDGPEAVDRRRDLWRRQAPAHYQIDQDVICFCPPPRAVRVEVRDRAIVTVTDRESGNALPPSTQSWFYTIEELFELIAEARTRNAAKLEVTYHPTLHYPTSIDVDYSFNTADEELFISVRALTALP